MEEKLYSLVWNARFGLDVVSHTDTNVAGFKMQQLNGQTVLKVYYGKNSTVLIHSMSFPIQGELIGIMLTEK